MLSVKLAAVALQADFGMRGLQAFRQLDAQLGFEGQLVAVHIQLQRVARHAGQVGVEGDAVGVLDHIDRGSSTGVLSWLMGCSFN